MRRHIRLWILLIALAAASPLGWYIPERVGNTTPWGEWSVAQLREKLGWVPREMNRLGSLYSAPLPKYAWRSRPGGSAQAYLLAGVIGTVGTLAAVYLMGSRLTKRGKR